MRKVLIVGGAVMCLIGLGLAVYYSGAKKEDARYLVREKGLEEHNAHIRRLESGCTSISITLERHRERPAVILTDRNVIRRILHCLTLDPETTDLHKDMLHACGGHVIMSFNNSPYQIIRFDHGELIHSFEYTKVGYVMLPTPKAKMLVRLLKDLGYSDAEIGVYSKSPGA